VAPGGRLGSLPLVASISSEEDGKPGRSVAPNKRAPPPHGGAEGTDPMTRARAGTQTAVSTPTRKGEVQPPPPRRGARIADVGALLEVPSM